MGKGFGTRKADHKAYRDFLEKILQIIKRTKSNQQAVYQLLEANLDKVDDNLAKVLRSWATAKLSEVELREARRIAGNIGDFCNWIAQFPLIKPETKWEIAITGYKVVATIFTEAYPKDWLMLQNNLGIAYRNQGQIDEAIAVFLAALDIRTLEVFLKVFPGEWAMLQNNLGNAYYSRSQIQENKLQDLALAITCYKEALRGTPKHKFPYDWAQTKQNLGGAYRKQGKTEEAITCYKIVLQEVYTEETFEWAQTQNNLGHAYSEQGAIDDAIGCFQLALKILTPAAYPVDCLNTGRGLGYMALKASQWTEAMQGYSIAIEAVEYSRVWGGTDAERQKFLEAEIDVYIGMVQACIRDDQLTKAIEYVERSKARNLVELLTTRNLYPKEVSQEVRDELDRRRQEIRAEQMRIDLAEWNQKVHENRTHLNQLRQLLNEWITETIKPIDPSFSLTQKVQGISFQEIQSLLPDNKTALIEWYILDETFVTFIITRQSPGIRLCESSPEDLQAFQDWGNEYLRDYIFHPYQQYWKDNLESRLYRLAEILHLEELLSHVPDTSDRLILIPHLSLHLLPLHALPLPNQKDKYLIDKFPRGVRYAPSCQLLQLTEKQERPDFSNLFAVLEPTRPDLPPLFYTNLEVETIRRSFAPVQVLEKEKATKPALQESRECLRSSHCLHFACHGSFNFAAPLQSGLALADESLTLAEIFNIYLPQCRLVTLSACETGLTDFTSISDEYIGLPSSFLYAGALSVVSSLWIVNSLSTCFLMIKFYENLRNFPKLEAGDVATALNQAQKWLRDLTCEEFEAVFAKYQSQIDEILAQLPKGKSFKFKESIKQDRKEIQALDRQPKPFANSYYWAAFTATGL